MSFIRRIKDKKGVSGVDIAIGLTVSILALASIVVAAGLNRDKSKAITATNELMNVRDAVELTVLGQGNYAAAGATLQADVVGSEFLPDRMHDGVNIFSAFSGAIVIATADVNGIADGYTVTMADLPDSACEIIAKTDLGNGTQAMTVNGAPGADVVMTQAEASAACANDNNDIIWTFIS